MRKTILFLATMFAAMFMSVSAATTALEQPKFFDNISVGVKGGLATPLNNMGGDARGMIGVEVQKQVTPVFGVGLEGEWTVNSSAWQGVVHSANAFDHQYVGVFTTTNWMNLIGKYKGDRRLFEVESVVGVGWLHNYATDDADFNTVGTKFGVNFNFNVGKEKQWTLAFKPSVMYGLSDVDDRDFANFDIRRASMQWQAGVTYHFKNHDGRRTHTFCNKVATQAEVDAMNQEINGMREKYNTDTKQLQDQVTNLTEANKQLTQMLKDCESREPEVVEVRAVNVPIQFKRGSAKLEDTTNATLVSFADELKATEETYQIVGYASEEGTEEFNQKLSEKRAKAVYDKLVELGVNPDQLEYLGEGETKQFSETDLQLNRVAVIL